MRSIKILISALVLSVLTGCSIPSGVHVKPINYTHDQADLQQVIDSAPEGATILCDRRQQLELAEPIIINKAVTLRGLNARLPTKLGRTSLIAVKAKGVTLSDIELHGNHDSVDQKDRAPLIRIHSGDFLLERCRFYDSSKDGIAVFPETDSDDIVGGTIRDIEAFRMGRDAVSISGGNEGLRVRDLTVENISLKEGYRRGAVEVSDGTDNIHVRGVYAESCVYAIDVQDHGGNSAPNTGIVIEDVTAVDCKHIIRTANSSMGHAGLKLRNFNSENCKAPVQISHTKDIFITDLKILNHQNQQYPPVSFKNCHGVNLKNVTIETSHFKDNPIQSEKCTDLNIKGLNKIKNQS